MRVSCVSASRFAVWLPNTEGRYSARVDVSRGSGQAVTDRLFEHSSRFFFCSSFTFFPMP